MQTSTFFLFLLIFVHFANDDGTRRIFLSVEGGWKFSPESDQIWSSSVPLNYISSIGLDSFETPEKPPIEASQRLVNEELHGKHPLPLRLLAEKIRTDSSKSYWNRCKWMKIKFSESSVGKTAFFGLKSKCSSDVFL